MRLEIELGERHGAAKKVALAQRYAERSDLLDLLARLDAFGDDGKIERLGELHDGGEHGNRLGPADPVDEGLVDLDLVEGKGGQIRE